MTDAVLDEVKEWRLRALDAVYPVVIFDALRVKIRDKDSRIIKNKAVYLAFGITGHGEREVFGLWIAENEGAKFWLSVMAGLRDRGLQDILIAVVDGLKGFPQGHHRRLPGDHGSNLLRSSGSPLAKFLLLKGSQGGRGQAARDLCRRDGRAGWDVLEAFDAAWGGQYPSIA